MRKILLPLLLLPVVLFSCKKENEDLSEIAKGNKFYPTEIGKYIVYDYDSTVWNDQLKAALPFKGQLRYTVVDTFRDAAGRLSYRINVERRKNDTDPYVPNDVLRVTPTDDRVEVMQRGLTFIKMVFPVLNGKVWNGNALISLDDKDNEEYDNSKWKYTYADFDREFDPGNNLYEHTVTVNEIDDQVNDPAVDSTVYASRNYSQEIYAYNVGMVYRERIYWVFQPKAPNGGSGGGSGYPKGYRVVLRAVENN